MVIPEGVVSIGGSAFSGCINLSTVTTPKSLQKIDSYAFYGCSALTDVYYGGSVGDYGAINIETYSNTPFINATKHFGLSVKLILNDSVYASETLQSGESYTFPDNPVNGTLEFLGWNEKADGLGESYFEGDTLVITASQTFYAQWECLHTGETEIRDYVAPTCVKKGYTGDTYCVVCGQKIADGTSINANGHTPADSTVEENRVNSTCTQDGHYNEVLRCKICNEIISSTEKTIPATGHRWSHTEYWSTDYSKCTIVFECQNDSNHIKSVECTSTGGTVVNPTCTEDGFAIYYISYSGAEGNVDVSKKVTLTASGHSYTVTASKPATCSETGFKTYYCSECKNTYTETLPTLNHTDSNNDGLCDRCGVLTDQNKYNVAKLKNISISIPANKSVNTGLKVTITASVKNLPDEYCIALFDGNTMVQKGDNKSVTYTSDELTETKTYTAKIVDGRNKAVSSNSQNKSVTITVNTGFFAMIIAFFQKLFGGGVVKL